jgi:WD40 repeat protein
MPIQALKRCRLVSRQIKSLADISRGALLGIFDFTTRLWDAETGQELRRFIGHTAGVENVVFSPDGKYLLSGSDDGTAMLWDVDYHTTIEYLCSVLLRDFTDDERTQYGITDNSPTCP